MVYILHIHVYIYMYMYVLCNCAVEMVCIFPKFLWYAQMYEILLWDFYNYNRTRQDMCYILCKNLYALMHTQHKVHNFSSQHSSDIHVVHVLTYMYVHVNTYMYTCTVYSLCTCENDTWKLIELVH